MTLAEMKKFFEVSYYHSETVVQLSQHTDFFRVVAVFFKIILQ